MKLVASVSAIAILAGLPLSAAHAQADSAVETRGDDGRTIVVTASRSGAALAELPVSASIVGEKALAEQLDYNTNIMRALEFAIPGLSPQREARGNCSANIRGRATALLINGIPVNENLRQSTCNQMYQISPFAIERIEVIRGGTALYGAGSPGGILNFVTRRAKGDRLEIDAVAQTSFNTSNTDDTFTTDLYLGAGRNFGNWDFYVGGSYTDGGGGRTPDGGYVPRQKYDSASLNGSLGADLAGGKVRLTGTYYREKKGQQYSADGTQAVGNFAPVGPIANHPQIDDDLLRSVTLALSYDHLSVLGGQELALAGYFQHQLYRQRDNFYSAGFGNDFFASDSDNKRLGLRSTLVKRLDLGAVGLVASYGFDFTRNSYYRPVVDAVSGTVLSFVSPEVTFDTYAVFGQAEFDFGRLRIVGGVRQEWYRGKVSDRDYDPALGGATTPGRLGNAKLALFNLGAVYDLTEGVQLYGGFSQGAEISQVSRAVRGQTNSSLVTPQPATSDQFELGLRGQLESVKFEVAAFRSTSKNASLLQSDPSCAGQTLCPLIPLRAPQKFWGFEGSADWTVTPKFDLGAVVTWQRGEIFDDGLGRYISYSTDIIAPLRITGSANWRPIAGLRMGLQATYYGAASFYTTAEQALGYVNTEAVFLMDASVGYRVGPAEVFLAASNLLDRKYVSVADQGVGFFYYQAEGRRVTIGLKGKF